MNDGPYTKVKRLLEDALELIVARLGGTTFSGVTIYKGRQGEQMTVPRLQIVAALSKPVWTDTGLIMWWEVTVGMMLVTQVDDTTRDENTEMSAALQDIVLTTDMAQEVNDLQEIRGIKMYDDIHGWEPGECEDGVDETEYVTAITVTARVTLPEE
jgi:hypothetical protein